jgi:hypothetical protein
VATSWEGVVEWDPVLKVGDFVFSISFDDGLSFLYVLNVVGFLFGREDVVLVVEVLLQNVVL